jgi:hypothetical protein
MQYTVVLLLLFGLYYGYYYWNRARKIAQAGGAEAFGQELYRKQFGLMPGEKVEHYFNGTFYLGPLRPDVSPSTFDNVLAGVSGRSYRGANVAFVLTDRDRLAIAVEWGKETKVSDKLDAMRGENLGMDPYKQFGNAPKPVVRRAEEVYAGHPEYPKPRDAPTRVSLSGKLEPCVLIQIDAPGSAPDTLWIDPLGAKALTAWAVLSRSVQA